MDNITAINLAACPLQYLSIGYVGETGARPVAFDFSAWTAEYGAGVLQLLLQRPGDANPYPVVLDINGTTATWTPDATDTEKTGQGQAQLVYTVGGVVVKNAIFRVLIAPSLGAAGDPPEPYETWLEQLTALAAETQQNALDAADSAEAAGTSAGAAAVSAGAAAQSALDAEAAKTGAEAAEQTAQQAATLARAKAAEAAEAAQIAGENADYAQQQRIMAEADAVDAHDSAESAAQSAEDAQAAASAAQTAASAAAASASAAAASASAAAASASAAAGSAADAAAAVTEVETKGAEQITAINQAGTTQIAAVDAAGAAQVQAIEDRGEEVIASIPSDYTELADDVSDLKSAISDIKTEVGGDIVYDKNKVISESTFYSLKIPVVTVGANIAKTLIPVTTADTYLFTIPNHSTKVTLPVIKSTSGAGVCFTDDNGIIISGYVNTAEDGGTYITLDIPSSATKIGVIISRSWDSPTFTFSTQSAIIDPTLSTSGKAADAKVTGDLIADLNRSMNEADEKLTVLFGSKEEYNDDTLAAFGTIRPNRLFGVASIGGNINNVNGTPSSCINYIIPLPERADTITCNVYKSSSQLGHVFIDDNNIIVGCYSNSVLDSGSITTFPIPKSATKFVFTRINSWPSASVTINISASIDLNIPIGLHVRPQNSGVLNAIKRARQLTDLKWTPLYDIARTSIVSGDSYYSDEHEYFEDEFSNGVEYTGIPYSDTATDYSRILGITKPLDVFVTTVRNDKSVEALESTYRQLDPSYYGVACTGLTAYALDLPYVYSMQYANIPGFTPQFYISRNGNRHDLKDLMLCDVLQISGHCALVTDIIYDDDGEVLFVEISEQTRLGNASKKVIGGPRGGIGRRVTWSAEEIYNYFENFQVYRYDYIDKVKYIPSPYSPMVDEGNRITDVDFPLLPYYGNRCVVEGQSRQIKLLASDNTYTHALVKKNGVAWNENGSTDYYTVSNGEVNIQCDSDDAVYTAKLITLNGNTIQYSTRSCEWYVVGDIAVSYTVGENSVQFTVTAGSDEFYPWFANVRDAVTINGYNTMIFDEYEKTTESNNTVYTFDVEYSTTPTQYLLGLKSDKYGVIYLSGQIS